MTEPMVKIPAELNGKPFDCRDIRGVAVGNLLYMKQVLAWYDLHDPNTKAKTNQLQE